MNRITIDSISRMVEGDKEEEASDMVMGREKIEYYNKEVDEILVEDKHIGGIVKTAKDYMQETAAMCF